MASSIQQPEEISLSYMGARLWAAKFGVFFFVAIITGLVYLFTQVAEPEYESEAQILIEARETPFTRLEADEAIQPAAIGEQDLATEVQVLLSRDVADQVIANLGLIDDSRFDAARETVSLVRSVLILLGLTDDPMRISAAERVYESFDSGLSVFNVPDSRVIVVRYRSEDPQLSAQVANAVVDTYQALQRENQASNSRSATSFLESEISGLRRQVADAEAAVARFRSNSRLFLGPNEIRLSAQQLSELSTELTRARAQQSEAAASAGEIRSLIEQQGTSVALPDAFATPLTQRLQEEQATLRARIAELSATLLPQHPRLQELQAQLSDLGRQIRDEAGRIAQRFDNEAQVAGARAIALDGQLGQLSAEASRVADAEVELRALEREAAAQRDLLSSYLVRFREAATRDDASLLPTNARIIQTASALQEPVFPRTLPMLVIAFVGSFTIATLAVISLAILAGAVPAVQSVENPPAHRRSEPPLVSDTSQSSKRAREPKMQQAPSGGTVRAATLPQASLTSVSSSSDSSALSPSHTHGEDQRREVTLNEKRVPRSPTSEPDVYLDVAAESRALFTRLRRAAPEGRGARHAILSTLISSDRPSDDEQCFALSLARSLAQAGNDCVLVDCSGALTSAGLLPDGPGFLDLISGNAGFDTALNRDQLSTAHLLAGGYGSCEEVDLSAPNAATVMDALAQTYDTVLVTLPAHASAVQTSRSLWDCVLIEGVDERAADLIGLVSADMDPSNLIRVAAHAPVKQEITKAVA